jgi:hypothetical protein
MADRRKVSLLDCAVAASAAVVPVMIGVVALVSIVRPADPDAAWRQGRNNSYVSVRHVAALKTFERAIVKRASETSITVNGAQLLDGIPACRGDWGEGGAPMKRIRRFLLGGTPEIAPAEEIAGHLSDFDGALLRFSRLPNGRVQDHVGIDAERWFAAAREALATPIEAIDAPGKQFHLRCADLVDALAALRRADSHMLESLAWRGSEGSATVARWRPEQEVQITARDVTRRNPWDGIAGCIYLGRTDSGDAFATSYFLAGARSIQSRLCRTAAVSGAATAASGPAGRKPVPVAGEPGPADVADDPRWMVPPSLFTLLQPLEPLRQPSGALYRRYTDADAPPGPFGRRPETTANRADIDGVSVDVGYSIDVTIDPDMQALAQKTVACYTGRHDICRALAMHRNEDGERPLGQQLLEGAMVRMAAVAVIDVASGRIEALAGALSPCARQEVEGTGREGGCDSRLPYRAHYRGDALLNPAIYHDAMPASTIKPIMAAAFLSDPVEGSRLLAAEQAGMQHEGVPARESLRGQLMRSDSARFLDRMFCADKSFVNCRRPWEVQAEARAFGWNPGCDAASDACGKADLLFGQPIDRLHGATGFAPGATSFAYGRLLSEPLDRQPGAPMHLMPAFGLDPGIVRRCAAGPDGRRLSDDDWEKCRGGAVVDVVAEGWGQGHARASALGVAGMMASLASAANGATHVPPPHLVESLHGVESAASDAIRADALRWAAPPWQPPTSRAAAEVILSGLSYSHRAGTARTACEEVFDARQCRAISWLAGKTGTPSFPSDGLSLDAIVRLCRDDAPEKAIETKRGVCGSLRPYKWYVAAYRADRSEHGPWTKTIAVLTERNWLSASGRVHGAGDTGPNPAAEIAMQIVGRKTGLIESNAP